MVFIKATIIIFSCFSAFSLWCLVAHNKEKGEEIESDRAQVEYLRKHYAKYLEKQQRKQK